MKADPSQQAVIDHSGQNLLVLAGAGSGKTTTIIQRVVRLIEQGVNPPSIMMLTFTNKAAKEMRERIIDVFIDRRINQDIPMITTFHQLGYRLIKQYPQLCLRPDEGQPTIMEEREADSLWLKSLENQGFTLDQYKEDPFYKELPEHLGNAGIFLMNDENSFAEFYNLLAEHGHEHEYQALGEATIAYTEAKIEQNTLDFNDMILLPIFLLKTQPSIAADLHSRISDITVDEAQDNNTAQYKLLKLISNNGQVPTTMVGDDDQTIYEWRGSEPDNIQNFLNEFSARLMLLEKNYRSNSDIVECSSRMVSNNERRISKTPYAHKVSEGNWTTEIEAEKESHSIAFSQSEDIEELGESLVKHIKKSVEQGKKPEDIAILYRQQKIGFFLDKILNSHGIATTVMTGTGLMDRAEVKMAVAALRLCANPFDRPSFNRLSELIPGLGGKTIETIFSEAKGQKQPLIFGQIKNLKPRQTNLLKAMENLVEPLKNNGPGYLGQWSSENLKDWMSKRHAAKVKDDIAKGRTEEDEERNQARVKNLSMESLGNIEIICQSINKLLEQEEFQKNPWEVITELSLDTPQNERSKIGVKLSTIHTFKGLESDEVHIAGFTTGIMPLQNDEGVTENPEEERRIAYVGMTRAKERLFLHHMNHFDPIYGISEFNKKELSPSIYLNELRTNERRQQIVHKEDQRKAALKNIANLF